MIRDSKGSEGGFCCIDRKTFEPLGFYEMKVENKSDILKVCKALESER